jgi:hypothetical protein
LTPLICHASIAILIQYIGIQYFPHREDSGKTQGRLREDSGKTQGRLREDSGKTQGRLKEDSIKEIMLDKCPVQANFITSI